MTFKSGMHLVITVVKKGWGDTVVEATIEKGAKGGTVLFGHGQSGTKQKSILGLVLNQEKEIVLTVVTSDLLDDVIQAAIEAGEIITPGVGICMSFPLDRMYEVDIRNEVPELPDVGPATLSYEEDEEECESDKEATPEKGNGNNDGSF